jgi:hypothetical protein
MMDIMEFIQQYQGEHVADAWDGAQPVEGLGSVVRGHLDTIQLHVTEQVVIEDSRADKLDFLIKEALEAKQAGKL